MTEYEINNQRDLGIEKEIMDMREGGVPDEKIQMFRMGFIRGWQKRHELVVPVELRPRDLEEKKKHHHYPSVRGIS